MRRPFIDCGRGRRCCCFVQHQPHRCCALPLFMRACVKFISPHKSSAARQLQHSTPPEVIFHLLIPSIYPPPTSFVTQLSQLPRCQPTAVAESFDRPLAPHSSLNQPRPNAQLNASALASPRHSRDPVPVRGCARPHYSWSFMQW